MPTAKRKPKPKSRAKRETPLPNEIEFSIKPGEKTTLTIEAGKEEAGAALVRIRVEGGKSRKLARQAEVKKEAAGWRIPAWLTPVRKLDLATWLFIGAVALYLVTRLVGLDRYPVYFFTDEAFQTQAMADLITLKYRNEEGTLLPAYFGNGMGLTVYLQWIPLALFGKSALVTRAVSAAITTLAAVAVGVILRSTFNLKYWWSGTLFLAMTPAWFLHSRTAFETAVFVTFYAAALCSYLLYRYRSPRYVYLTVFFAALAFYSYNPAQLVVPVTGLALLASDWRYHWENRRAAIGAGLLLALLAIPYLRFRFDHPNSPGELLHLLGSYLVSDMPLAEKIRVYVSEYFFGLSAWYWYIPNDRDQIRHIMKDYGHIMIATLPFTLIGLAHILRNLRDSANRAILVVMLVSPIGGAMVQIGITRSLMFAVPAALLAALGLDHILHWIQDPAGALKGANNAARPNGKRILASLGILLAGAILAGAFKQPIDRVASAALALLLAFHGLGVFDKLKQGLSRVGGLAGWKIPQRALSLAVFIALAGANVRLLTDALTNGPYWWPQYAELQYGAFQIYDIIEEYHQERPEAKIIFTSAWANGADVLNRFFLGIPPWLNGGSIEGYIQRKFPIDENTTFIMAPWEFDLATQSDRLTGIRVERIVPYPDGSPAFYFVRLRYVDHIDEIFAAEQAARAVLREGTVTIDGQEVGVRFSYLDAVSQTDTIRLLFDDDPYTYAKTFEANPFIIELTFPESRTLGGFSITVGSANVQIAIMARATPDSEPVALTFEGKGTEDEPTLSFDFPQPVEAQWLHLELLDPYSPPPAQIHIWKLEFKFNE
ncbi:MAG: glycosyltransferase family 39 protein [Anaerolineales bacterium]|nr:glycosyltransferase family 39 protein [Anaerolineales bacterium]